jgi:hypothetical protein
MTVTRNPLSVLTSTGIDICDLLASILPALSSLKPITQAAWWRILLVSPIMIACAAFLLLALSLSCVFFLTLNVLAWPLSFFSKRPPQTAPSTNYVIGERGPEIVWPWNTGPRVSRSEPDDK